MIGLKMAAGHLGQAREWLSVAAGAPRGPARPGGHPLTPPLVLALEHARTAAGWLAGVAAARSGAGLKR